MILLRFFFYYIFFSSSVGWPPTPTTLRTRHIAQIAGASQRRPIFDTRCVAARGCRSPPQKDANANDERKNNGTEEKNMDAGAENKRVKRDIDKLVVICINHRQSHKGLVK